MDVERFLNFNGFKAQSGKAMAPALNIPTARLVLANQCSIMMLLKTVIPSSAVDVKS